eukprot:3599792-Prymnesium_polylepis.1
MNRSATEGGADRADRRRRRRRRVQAVRAVRCGRAGRARRTEQVQQSDRARADCNGLLPGGDRGRRLVDAGCSALAAARRAPGVAQR